MNWNRTEIEHRKGMNMKDDETKPAWGWMGHGNMKPLVMIIYEKEKILSC